MFGKVKKVELKNCVRKDNKQKFNVFEFTCDVKIDDKGEIKTLKGSWSEDYAKKYLAFMNLKSKDMIGKELIVTIAKREYTKDDETRTITYIKYAHFIDEKGNPIYLPKDGESDTIDW